MKKRSPLPPNKIRESVSAEIPQIGGWYESVSTPEKITCKRCGEEQNSIGQEDGLCLKCRWAAKSEARAGTRAGGGMGT